MKQGLQAETIRRIERNLSLLLDKSPTVSRQLLPMLTPASLKKAYYRKARALHPDTADQRECQTQERTRRFIEVKDAYDELLIAWNAGEFESLLSTNQRATHKQSEMPGKTRIFHRGSLPSMELRFAQFLYYSGTIDWHTLIDSVSWQLRERPKIGDLAIETGYLDAWDVMAIICKKGSGELFGDAALRLGYLTAYERIVLLGRQRLLGMPIGSYYIRNGHIGEQEIEGQLFSQRRHNYRVRSGW